MKDKLKITVRPVSDAREKGLGVGAEDGGVSRAVRESGVSRGEGADPAQVANQGIGVGLVEADQRIGVNKINMEINEVILQWNVQGMTTSKEEVIKLIDTYKPCAISIQETFYSNDFLARLSGYHGLCKQGHFNHRFHGGVALYLHNSYPYQEIRIDSPYQVVAAKISLKSHTSLCIASIYISPRTNLDKEEMNNIIRQLPRPFIITGDFNAHHTDWGNRTTDRKGNIVHEMITENNLNILNGRTPTHISGTGIDLTISSADITPDLTWCVIPSVLSSDHHPILVTVAGDREAELEDKTIYNYKKGKWKEYKQDPIWTQTLAESCEKEYSAESMIDELYAILSDMLNKYVPKYKQRRYYAKPWWNSECQAAWNERERKYRKYQNTNTDVDKIAWKRARAIAKQAFKQAKQQCWRDFVSNLNHRTPSSEVWNMIRRIRGKEIGKITMLQEDGRRYNTVSEIANKLAESFEEISSDSNYSDEFLHLKRKQERQTIELDSDNLEQYNIPFTRNELEFAIKSNKITAPGPDKISNLMLKHLPDAGREYLLKIYNKLWQEGYFPNLWRTAHVVAIPKPGKDHTNAKNYRPISLTSCVCKTYEKMINRRLVEYIENNKLFAHIQCGFRKYRSTTDHLVRFDTYVRKGLVDGKKVTAVSFDLEKAYDTVWRYGVIRDLYEMGMRGRLPSMIRDFLSGRQFQVKIGGERSEVREQQTGVPQGSTLSVTLFAIRINSLAKKIPGNIFASIFVDDVLIAHSDHEVDTTERILQGGVDKISQWARENGFKFSETKTAAIQFYSGTQPVRQPQLMLNGQAIATSETIKFLGLNWDSKLQWNCHILKTKQKCQKDLNLLKSISSTSWGADTLTLMRLYRSILRPKIEYGCIIYGSANQNLLNSIESIANDAKRISTGAFKSTPIDNLNIVSNEPTLELRRQELLLRYYFRLKCHILNPAYKCILDTGLELFFRTRRDGDKSIILRIKDAIDRFNVPTQPVLTHITPRVFSWMLATPGVETDTLVGGKSVVPEEVLRNMHRSKIKEYEGYKSIYTDGSKMECGVGAAAVMGRYVKKASLPSVASIMTAELIAIRLALSIVSESDHGKFIICSDSMSAINAVDNYLDNSDNALVSRIAFEMNDLISAGKKIAITWVPSHVGVVGNEKVDAAAKEAARRPEEFIPIPYRDWDRTIKSKLNALWKNEWQANNRDLVAIKPNPGQWKISNVRLNRKEEVVVNRLRMEHTRVTHKYLFEPEHFGQMPVCALCHGGLYNVKHILVQCPELEAARQQHFTRDIVDNISVSTLLEENGPLSRVLEYLRAIGVYDEI